MAFAHMERGVRKFGFAVDLGLTTNCDRRQLDRLHLDKKLEGE